MSAHTPGPWEVVDGRRIGVILPNAIGGGYDSHCIAVTQESAHINAEANARLIAAAPELLEALKAIKDHPNTRYEVEAQLGESTWNAIAKAEGAAS